MSGCALFLLCFYTLIFVICQVDLSALFTTRQQPIPDHEQVKTANAVGHNYHFLTPNQINCLQIRQKQAFSKFSILGNLPCKFGCLSTVKKRKSYFFMSYPYPAITMEVICFIRLEVLIKKEYQVVRTKLNLTILNSWENSRHSLAL